MAAIILVGLLAAVWAWVLLAPSDPAVWHVAISDETAAMAGPCAEQVRQQTGGARAACLLPGTPSAILTRLARIAATHPRTTLLAGTPDQGRMTWIARSRLIGFPDYLTAEASTTPEGTRLLLHSRLRFGQGDMGVNAARLKLWLTALDQP